MDIQKWKSSPLWVTVNSIFTGEDVSYKVRWKGTLHTQGQDYPIFKVISVDFIRDYHSSMMDECQLKILIPLGDYTYLVYPNKDNLEVTLNKTYLKSVGDTIDTSRPIEEVRYKAIFDPRNKSLTGTDAGNRSQTALNSSQFVTISLRLMDRNVEPLRVKTVHGIYKGVTAEQVIKSILIGESQNIQVDGNPAIGGIDVVPPDATATIKQLSIPSGTYVCEVPTYLQEQVSGVYKHGIGTYYQRFNGIPMWFVYPLYDFNRFDNGEEQNVAILYGAPPKFSSGVERTFRVNAGVLEAVITTEKRQVNASDVTQLNDGVGFRFNDQNAYMNKPVIIDDQGNAIGARGNLNQEAAFINRGDGLNFVPVVRNFGTNSYHEISKVSARQATLLQFGWQNSDPSFIYPAMPVKYCYMQDDQFIELKGTVLGVHETSIRQGTLSETDRYLTQCVLSIATELNTKLPEFDEEQSFDPTFT